ncbi:MAG: glycosyltransferase [Prosthecobacter sp.]|nr:glycosyltransferase [Prosthecobacter sp.]
MIEKLVHQTWKNACPEHWIFRKSRTAVSRFFPGWEYKLWTDEDLDHLVRTRFPEYYAGWDSLDRGIKKVDVARYFILYLHGGIYADLDFIFTQDPAHLFEDGNDLYFYQSTQALVKGWDFLGNAFMGSTAGHPFWLQLVDYMLALPATTPVLHHTGPLAIGAFYKTLVEKPGTTIFGPDLFDNQSCQDGIGKRVYGYHMRMASWHGPGRRDGLVKNTNL